MVKRSNNQKIQSQKINSRYRLVKINHKFYLVDFADAKCIKTYVPSFFGLKETYHAWELSDEDVTQQFHGFHPKRNFSGAVIGSLGVVIGAKYFYPIVAAFPEITIPFLLRIVLFLGILSFMSLTSYFIALKQSKKTYDFKKEVKINSEVYNYIGYFCYLGIFLLLTGTLLWMIFLSNKINIFQLGVVVLIELTLFFIKFISSPNDATTYTVVSD